ncbi:hypothetical protein M501DRAFT_924250 [Patellaria atrata CBS 101060]|uniref:Uncharacterized protein n=1 Tax=Patellaria atrata CBS 101060 TaxID=1346257 RepID=A0A9P4VV54_9PEZI|nr:hypothetical protein M501DRAFT_924250 [Patellaria atrata CBS 101060]
MASALGITLGILALLLLLTFASWVTYTRLRARRLGLPPPSLNPFHSSTTTSSSFTIPAPAPGGIVGWINDRVRGFRNRRTARGAYESTSGYDLNVGGGQTGTGRGGTGRGRATLDPDEAWDSRVGTEADAYGEDVETGGYGGAGSYAQGYTGYSNAIPVGGEERGRSRSREIDRRYDEVVTQGPGQGVGNPFADAAERSDLSLRGVSPRPIETGVGAGAKGGQGKDDSPTERRSMFRENV